MLEFEAAARFYEVAPVSPIFRSKRAVKCQSLNAKRPHIRRWHDPRVVAGTKVRSKFRSLRDRAPQ